ncbi:hypothetical protein AB6A40_002137 [Gnathostoma spinigerum]|uniref:Uncharacterized protein n=1 Tax=Gnathostoma spinigerum TaxID=75299 RepID=A0ABD6E5U7_9BILA
MVIVDFVYKHDRCKTFSSQFHFPTVMNVKHNCVLCPSLALFVVALLSAAITLLISRYLYTGTKCSVAKAIRDDVFGDEVRWREAESYVVARKHVILLKLRDTGRCFIAPQKEKSPKEGDNHNHYRPNDGQQYELVPGPLSSPVIEQIGGEEALKFCDSQVTYLLKRPKEHLPCAESTEGERRKRAERSLRQHRYEGNNRAQCKDVLIECHGGVVGEIRVCNDMMVEIRCVEGIGQHEPQTNDHPH